VNLGRIYYAVRRKYHGGNIHKRLDAALTGEFWLILLPDNRLKKFRKDFPKSVEAEAHLKTLAEARRKAVSPELAQAMHFNDPGYDLDELDADKVDDPALKKVIPVAKLAVQKDSTISLLRADQREYGLAAVDGKAMPEVDVVKSRYPLLGTLTSWNRPPEQDLYLYINAAYAARKE